jgi:hypothetical protein
VKGKVSSRCTASSTFDELAACRRADGTLQTFAKKNTDWRVRYFVRYWQMPCDEAPTLQEAYIFNMVTNDLYNDTDLNDAERIDIRNAMFDGEVRCKP